MDGYGLASVIHRAGTDPVLPDDGKEAPEPSSADSSSGSSESSAAPHAGTGTAAAGQRIDVVNLPDPAHGVPSGSNYVVLPPGYDTDTTRRYPVVYLIHGYPFG